MTISPEEHDYIGDIIAADNAKCMPRRLPARCGNESESELAWLASQAFASYGASEEAQATFYMGWDAAMKSRGDQ